MEDKVLTIISRVLLCDRTSLRRDTLLASVPSWDSLVNLRLFLEIEALVGGEIDLEEGIGLRSVGDWIDVAKRYSAKGGGIEL